MEISMYTIVIPWFEQATVTSTFLNLPRQGLVYQIPQ